MKCACGDSQRLCLEYHEDGQSFGLIHESNDFGRNGLIDIALGKDDDQDRIFVVMSAVGAQLHL